MMHAAPQRAPVAAGFTHASPLNLLLDKLVNRTQDDAMANQRIIIAITALTDDIVSTVAIVDSESRHPGSGGVDESDDIIKDGKTRIVTLRRIRQELEDLS